MCILFYGNLKQKTSIWRVGEKNANHGFAIILYRRLYALIYRRLSPKDERIITKLQRTQSRKLIKISHNNVEIYK